MERIQLTLLHSNQVLTLDEKQYLYEMIPHENSDGFPLVAGKVNNEVFSLNFRPYTDSQIEGVYLNSREGLRIYRRSLCFLLEAAVSRIGSDTELMIDHSLGNSFYYHFEKGQFSEKILNNLKETMKQMVKEDLPMGDRHIAYALAEEYFTSERGLETHLLLQNHNQSLVRVNHLGDYQGLYHGPLVPCTGILNIWDLVGYNEGIRLRFAPSSTPMKLQKNEKPLEKLFEIYQEHKRWGKIRGVHCVGQLNTLYLQKREVEHFVNVSEALHMQKISQIAENIYKRKDSVRVVLIAGPSSSGKTTFTKKLSLSLQTLGFDPQLVSLDDYYRPHEEVPLDDDGKMDLEALEALDVPLLNHNLLDLFKGEEVEIPIFDFKQGGLRQKQGRPLQMKDNSILLMEGIHGLNDRLTPQIPEAQKYKIYISALTQLNLDDYNRIATTDNRIIRRMVRDHQFRNYSPQNTLRIFPSVMRGERKNIFPFQGEADSMFNSALDYELGVLKIFAEPLLRSVKPTEDVYPEVCRLLVFLSNFNPISPSLVPRHSILREFIGDSGFHY